MKAITPDRNQQELQEEGGTDFGFAFGDAGRFRVSVLRQQGSEHLDHLECLIKIPVRLSLFGTCYELGSHPPDGVIATVIIQRLFIEFTDHLQPVLSQGSVSAFHPDRCQTPPRI